MFGRLSDRFCWTPEEISALNSFQLEAYIGWIADNPLPITIAVDPPKKAFPKRRR